MENDNPFADTTKPNKVEPEHLRLSVMHLFVFMTAVGVIVSVRSAMHALWGSDISVVHHVQRIIVACVEGATFGGAIIFAYHALASSVPVKREPGHWLLLYRSLHIVAGILVSLAFWVPKLLLEPDSPPNWLFTVNRSLAFCSQVAFAILALLLAVLVVRTTRWRVFFVILALLQLVWVAASHVDSWLATFPYFLMAVPILTLLTTICTVGYDTWVGPRRDWLHWVSVACAGCGPLLSLSSWITYLVERSS